MSRDTSNRNAGAKGSSTKSNTFEELLKGFIELVNAGSDESSGCMSTVRSAQRPLQQVKEILDELNAEDNVCPDKIVDALFDKVSKLREDFTGQGKKPYSIRVQRVVSKYDLMRECLEQNMSDDDKNDNSKLTCVAPVRDTGVTFANLAGMEAEKRQVEDSFVLPFQYPMLFPQRTAGVLLYGPPGTGKTLLAKAMATELSRNHAGANPALFFAPDPASLKGKFVGEVEAKITAVFTCARKALDRGEAKYAIIFFDEFDSIAGRKNGEDHTMALSVNTLLQLLDGFGSDKRLSCIAATNYADRLEPAILRRFPVKIFVDLPTKAARERIILDILKKRFASWKRGAPSSDEDILKLIDEHSSHNDKLTAEERVKAWVQMFGPHPSHQSLFRERSQAAEFSHSGSGVGFSASDITAIMTEALNAAADAAVVQRHPEARFSPFPPTSKSPALYIYNPDATAQQQQQQQQPKRGAGGANNKTVQIDPRNDAAISKIVTFDISMHHVQQAMKKVPTSVTVETYEQSLVFGMQSHE